MSCHGRNCFYQKKIYNYCPAISFNYFIFQVVPYWGNSQDRRILRKFWDSQNLHQEEASFHVVITSYQLVIQDVKYFQRIKWQYMILDEAQAIKSSSRLVHLKKKTTYLSYFPYNNQLSWFQVNVFILTNLMVEDYYTIYFSQFNRFYECLKK